MTTQADSMYISQDDPPGTIRCRECDRVITPADKLQHCDRCRPGYIASRAYLYAYSKRVREGWYPDNATPAPMPSAPITPAWITAGDLADFNSDLNASWQRARITPLLLGSMEILTAFRHGIGGTKAHTVVLVCGSQYPIAYFVVEAATKLDLWLPSPDADTWQTRKFPPAMPPRNFVYDASFLYPGPFLPKSFPDNEGVMPLRLTITYYAGNVRLASAVSSFRKGDQFRKIKVVAVHDVITSEQSEIWNYTDALRDMANHLGTLSKASKGW
jgi:hypothetical protein